MRKVRLRPLLVAALVVAAGVANAQPQPAGLAACQACHGAAGISAAPTVPNLGGQKPGYLEAQLRAFRAGERHSDLMQAIAHQLSDADITALAAFWAAQAPAGDPHAAAGGAGAHNPFSLASRMSLPADFPKGFVRYQALPAADAAGPVERYANAVAIRAAKAGLPLPAGSVIVTVNHDKEGAITGYVAMESRAGWGEAIPALLRNGDWDYAVIGADHKTRTINQAQCLACHKPAAASSYVFTIKDLRAAAAPG